jgi:uncharacterized delta-60 repeat protein
MNRVKLSGGVLLACLMPLMLTPLASARESLDPSFGKGGISFPGIGGVTINGLAQNSAGKLVAAGGGLEGFLVGRYLRNGSVDETFGREQGTVSNDLGFDAEARSLAIQPGGKIVAAGSSLPGTMLLVRYLPDGNRDPTFGKDGISRTHVGWHGGGAQDVAVLSNNHLLAAGYGITASHTWKGVVASYRPDGTLDTRFGDGGTTTFTTAGRGELRIAAMRVLPSGKILLAGNIVGRVMVVRLLADGSPDPSFSGDGFAYVDVGSCRCRYAYASGLALDRRGRAIVSASLAGPDPEPAALLRFLPDGRLDRGFGKGGVVSTYLGTRVNSHDVVVEHNGRIVLAASYNVPGSGEARVAVVRYLSDGRVDSSFGRNGFFTRNYGIESIAYAAVVQHNGRVVIGGRANLNSSRRHEDEAPKVFLIRFLP